LKPSSAFRFGFGIVQVIDLSPSDFKCLGFNAFSLLAPFFAFFNVAVIIFGVAWSLLELFYGRIVNTVDEWNAEMEKTD
jgi:hypothetical protein